MIERSFCNVHFLIVSGVIQLTSNSDISPSICQIFRWRTASLPSPRRGGRGGTSAVPRGPKFTQVRHGRVAPVGACEEAAMAMSLQKRRERKVKRKAKPELNFPPFLPRHIPAFRTGTT